MSLALVNQVLAGDEHTESTKRPHLGAAHVVEVERDAVTISLADGTRRRATLAFSVPYRTVVGDTLLAIGDDTGCWVIGVIDGQGETDLSFSGDVRVASRRGAVRIEAAQGVEIAAPDIELRATRLTTLANRMVERVTSLWTSVRDTLDVRAGQTNTIVDGTSHTQAKSANLVTEEKVRINGKAIHLG